MEIIEVVTKYVVLSIKVAVLFLFWWAGLSMVQKNKNTSDQYNPMSGCELHYLTYQYHSRP